TAHWVYPPHVESADEQISAPFSRAGTGEGRMDDAEVNQSSDWVQVAEVGQLWEAELIAGRLKNEEIDARIIDQTFHQEPLPNVRSFAVVRVMVPADHK